jgi:hypothetical protein
MDDGPPGGPRAQGRPRFVHTDVITAYSPWCSPSTPDDYVRALTRQYSLGPESDDQSRPALAIADYWLHSVVKTAVACDRAGVDHIVGLRVRVVPQRAKRTFLVSPDGMPMVALPRKWGVSGRGTCRRRVRVVRDHCWQGVTWYVWLVVGCVRDAMMRIRQVRPQALRFSRAPTRQK